MKDHLLFSIQRKNIIFSEKKPIFPGNKKKDHIPVRLLLEGPFFRGISSFQIIQQERSYIELFMKYLNI